MNNPAKTPDLAHVAAVAAIYIDGTPGGQSIANASLKWGSGGCSPSEIQRLSPRWLVRV